MRLEEKHAGQMRALRQTAQDKKPTRPQYSRELLRQRRVIEFLAKQGNYVLAERAHAAADAREADELESTLQNYDVEVSFFASALAWIVAADCSWEGVYLQSDLLLS